MAADASRIEKEQEFFGFNKDEVVKELIDMMEENISNVVDGFEMEIVRKKGRRVDEDKLREVCNLFDEQIRDAADYRFRRFEKYLLEHIFRVPDEVLANPDLYRRRKEPSPAEVSEPADAPEAPGFEYAEPVDDAEFQEIDAKLEQKKAELKAELQRQRCLHAEARILAARCATADKASADVNENKNLGDFDGSVVGRELNELSSNLPRCQAKLEAKQSTVGGSSSGNGASNAGSPPKRPVATGQRPMAAWSPKKPRTTTQVFG